MSASSQVPACGLHPVGTSIPPELMSIIIPVGVNGDETQCGNTKAQYPKFPPWRVGTEGTSPPTQI
ncbi:hypothetical protein DV515_00016769 [Chloebia gouldiae]|uniref:Uncharacterized protein n=1 Tax=Chloebia gouldiae TaxID=44316 RepID=A0A3L8RAD0_CHLGU|nr:hypothetical protein DV515_00016763 [Chloebia gouldiae]RLV76649.1 hypothetical protein DV515_00016769 [Chloebia gouldiae]